MANEKTTTLVNTKVMTQFIALAGIASVLPFYIHLQWVTGPIVNAILIIVLMIIGIRSALVLCLVPSLMALAGGLLPAILAPAVPFIMLGNVIFVLTVDRFYNYTKNAQTGYWLGVIAAAGLKFLFLLFSVNFITALLFRQELAAKIVQMMSWPQFATALAGGLIAWAVLKWLKRF
jgi:hypothetical protein